MSKSLFIGTKKISHLAHEKSDQGYYSKITDILVSLYYSYCFTHGIVHAQYRKSKCTHKKFRKNMHMNLLIVESCRVFILLLLAQVEHSKDDWLWFTRFILSCLFVYFSKRYVRLILDAQAPCDFSHSSTF